MKEERKERRINIPEKELCWYTKREQTSHEDVYMGRRVTDEDIPNEARKKGRRGI